jgi:hypothetical protein
LKDLFPKFSTTDAATADENSLGGQCPGAHVHTSRSGIELKTRARGKTEAPEEKRGLARQPYGISAVVRRILRQRKIRACGFARRACTQICRSSKEEPEECSREIRSKPKYDNSAIMLHTTSLLIATYDAKIINYFQSVEKE